MLCKTNKATPFLNNKCTNKQNKNRAKAKTLIQETKLQHQAMEPPNTIKQATKITNRQNKITSLNPCTFPTTQSRSDFPTAAILIFQERKKK